MVSNDGVRVDTAMISAIADWPVLTTHGLASFFRRFISGFRAHIFLIMKYMSFVWTPEAQVAFETTKKLLTSNSCSRAL